MSEYQTADLGDVTLRYVDRGDADAPLVLFVHGFPEGWYSWRHQLAPVAAAGFHAVAMDVRGYGGSSRPSEIADYAISVLAKDMADLARHVSNRPAVIVGHDWGAPIAWMSALLYPEVFRAVAGLSVLHAKPGDVPDDQVHDRVFTERGKYFYVVDFQQQGVAEAELERDPAATIRRFYYALSGDTPEGSWPTDKVPGDGLLKGLPEPNMPLPWLSHEDVAHYAAEFAHSGFRGPLNRYRNRRRDWEFRQSLPSHVISQPSLFISGTRDLATQMAPARVWEDLPDVLPGLRGQHMLEGCGHWTQQERPEEVNRLLIDWLQSL